MLQSPLLPLIFWGSEGEDSAAHLAALKMEGFIYSPKPQLLSVVYFCIKFSAFYPDLEVMALLIFTLVTYST